jgi:hypothetical protein
MQFFASVVISSLLGPDMLLGMLFQKAVSSDCCCQTKQNAGYTYFCSPVWKKFSLWVASID